MRFGYEYRAITALKRSLRGKQVEVYRDGNTICFKTPLVENCPLWHALFLGDIGESVPIETFHEAARMVLGKRFTGEIKEFEVSYDENFYLIHFCNRWHKRNKIGRATCRAE